MHDDLIDGLGWALAQGIGEPDRTGFFGCSYSGYSALMASHLHRRSVWHPEPDQLHHGGDPTLSDAVVARVQQAARRPDTAAGKAFLADRSPLNHLERATKSILIAQGIRIFALCRPSRSRW